EDVAFSRSSFVGGHFDRQHAGTARAHQLPAAVDLSEADAHAFAEHRGRAGWEELSVDEGAVLAREVADGPALAGPHDLRVLRRCKAIVDPDRARTGTADDALRREIVVLRIAEPAQHAHARMIPRLEPMRDLGSAL